MTVGAHELICSERADFWIVRYVCFGGLVDVRIGHSKVDQVYRVFRRIFERQRLPGSTD